MNKIAERIYIEWFTKQKNWQGSTVTDYEKPDFIIDVGGNIVGVEVTNLYKNERRKGSPQKANESFNYKWLHNVPTQYYEKNDVPIRVQVLVKGK